jgi:hypothetical protein
MARQEQLVPPTLAEQATQDLKAGMDSVNLINELVALGVHSEEVDSSVQANYQHLEIILTRENVIADATDKTPYLDAIAAGKAFAPDVE